MEHYAGREDHSRIEQARTSLRYFLEVYFPSSTGLSPLSPDHLAIIDRIQVLIMMTGRGLNIMPRGFAKSTLSENSLLWALLYGYRKYALFFGCTQGLATKGLESITRELMTNDLLLQDFPAACVPFLALEGKVQRAPSQSYRGKLTRIRCTAEAVQFPVIEGFAGSGAVLETYGILAPPRGARYKDARGRNVRPDIAVIDDPQTSESARSFVQSAARMQYIKRDIAMMGSHGKRLSMICNATIIEEHDAVDQLSKEKTWTTIRVAMLESMPTHLDELWLGPYAEIRRNVDKSDPMGQIKAKLKSSEFYAANKDRMAIGAKPAWENIGLEEEEGELDAIQHAMNIYIDEGPAAFYAECQNQPLRQRQVSCLEIDREGIVNSAMTIASCHRGAKLCLASTYTTSCSITPWRPFKTTSPGSLSTMALSPSSMPHSLVTATSSRLSHATTQASTKVRCSSRSRSRTSCSSCSSRGHALMDQKFIHHVV